MSDNAQRILALKPDYVATINPVIAFLQNKNPTLAHAICSRHYLPEAGRFAALEDLDWAKKMMAKGYRVAYQAEATIIHVHEERWTNVFNRYRREAIALRLIQKNETFNFLTFLTLFWKNARHDYQQALHDGVFAREFFSIFLFRFNQFWGTYRGYKQSYLMDNHVRERFYYPKGFVAKKTGKDDRDRMIDYSKIHQ